MPGKAITVLALSTTGFEFVTSAIPTIWVLTMITINWVYVCLSSYLSVCLNLNPCLNETSKYNVFKSEALNCLYIFVQIF